MTTEEQDILDHVPDSKKPSVPVGLQHADNNEIIEYLFSENNHLLTALGGEFELPKDTQSLLAYFSGGCIVISRTHRYDGRVLAFMDLLKRKNRPLRLPFYADLGLAQSRNVVRGKFAGKNFLYSEVALFKPQASRSKKEGPVFVGKYISFPNELEMKGRIVINIRKTESPLDLPTKTDDLTVLEEKPQSVKLSAI